MIKVLTKYDVARIVGYYKGVYEKLREFSTGHNAEDAVKEAICRGVLDGIMMTLANMGVSVEHGDDGNVVLKHERPGHFDEVAKALSIAKDYYAGLAKDYAHGADVVAKSDGKTLYKGFTYPQLIEGYDEAQREVQKIDAYRRLLWEG